MKTFTETGKEDTGTQVDPVFLYGFAAGASIMFIFMIATLWAVRRIADYNKDYSADGG